MLAAISAAIVAYAILYSWNYRGHFLNGDEIAVVTATRDDDWRKWFTEGYGKYFIIYEDWFRTSSFNLLRPVMNFIIWIGLVAFGDQYFLHFALYFAVIIATAYFFRHIQIAMGVSPGVATYTGLLLLTIPAVICEGLVNIPFYNDFWALVFVLVSFYALLQRSFVVTFVFLVLAVFNKETVWFAPVAACLSWAVLYRARIQAITLLIPLAAILAARRVAFGTFFGSLTADQSGLRDTALGWIKGLVLWPLGTVDFSALGNANGHISFSLVFQGALVLANLAFWFGLVIALIRFRHPIFRSFSEAISGTTVKGSLDHDGKEFLVVLIFLVGALSFGVLAGQRDRYGASIHAFLLLAAALTISRSDADNRLLRLATWCGLLAVLIAFVDNGIAWWRTTFVDNSHVEAKMHRALVAMKSRTGKVYVAGAPDTFPSPRFLSRAWGLAFDTTYISQFVGCEKAAGAETTLEENQLTIRVPDCAQVVFRGASPAILAAGVAGPLVRAGIGTYSFSSATIKHRRRDPRDVGVIDFGNTIKVDLVAFDDVTILAYDWNIADYRVLFAPGPKIAPK